MIWANVSWFQKRIRCAAVFAAHFVCAGTALAENVVFLSPDDAVVIEGQFVDFDGSVVTVLSDAGLVSFRADGMTCEGPECPNFESYVPRIRMVGAARMADVLLPSLIDAYARDLGWQVRENAKGFALSRSDGSPQLDIALTVAEPKAAFDEFIGHEADVLMSVRELSTTELSTAQSHGLGRLDRARQARILALDALVPVVDVASGRATIEMSTLTKAFAGTSDLFNVVTAQSLAGQMEGFEDRFMSPFGLSIGPDANTVDDIDTLLTDLGASPNRLALVPYGQTGTTQPLALSGPCGLQSQPAFLSLKTEDYPLTFPMFLYLPQRNRHPQVEAFLDWMRSPSAQLVIRRAGFVDLAAVPIPLADQGDRLAAAITSAGREIPLGELQRMIRILSPQVRMSSTFRFEPGSTRLDGQSRSNVMQLAQSVRDGRFGAKRLMFVGFSDGRGPAEANRDLSAARAEAVRRAVEAALGGNIPANVTLDVEAFGEALPMACDDTIWGQQTNRRVELWVGDLP